MWRRQGKVMRRRRGRRDKYISGDEARGETRWEVGDRGNVLQEVEVEGDRVRQVEAVIEERWTAPGSDGVDKEAYFATADLALKLAALRTKFLCIGYGAGGPLLVIALAVITADVGVGVDVDVHVDSCSCSCSCESKEPVSALSPASTHRESG